MKRAFFAGLFMLLYVAHSQTLPLQIQESKVYKMTTPRVQNDFILPDGKGGFVTISTKRSGFLANPLVFESYVTYYDNNMEQVFKKTFKLNKGSVKGSIKAAFLVHDTLNMINLETNYRKKYISFKRIVLDAKTGEAREKEFLKIDRIYPKNEVNLYVNLNSLYYEKLKYYSDVNFFNPKIFVKFSDNQQYFAIIYRGFETTKTIYQVNVFDKTFNKVYTGTLFNNSLPELFYINDLVVDDKTGDVYVAGKLLKQNPMKVKHYLNADNLKHFILYKVSKSGVKSFSIKPEKVVEQLYLIKSKELVIYGFYRNRIIDVNDIDGIYRMNMDVSSFIKRSEMYDNFSKKLVSTDYKKSRKRSKNHKMIVRKSYLLSDGSLLINSEDFYIPSMVKKKEREAQLREVVADIFSIKVSREGKVIWSNGIYKEQFVKPRLALHSFFSTLHKGYNYLLFTDTRMQKSGKKDPFYLSGKDLQNLYGAKISPHGELKKGLVKENKRSKFRFMPIEGTMISEDEAIIPAKDHQFIKFYKIKF